MEANKIKIYLAKSNEANTDLVASVRQLFRSLDYVELVEFKGGTYTNVPLLNSDYLFVIPSTDSDVCDDGGELYRLVVGKGLYTQLRDFNLNQSFINKTFILDSSIIDKITVFDKCLYSFKRLDEASRDENDWTNYGDILVKKNMYTLDSVLSILKKQYEFREKESFYTDIALQSGTMSSGPAGNAQQVKKTPDISRFYILLSK